MGKNVVGASPGRPQQMPGTHNWDEVHGCIENNNWDEVLGCIEDCNCNWDEVHECIVKNNWAECHQLGLVCHKLNKRCCLL